MPASATPCVQRDGDACGMKVPAVKQKRITAEDVLLPSLCVCVCVYVYLVFIKLHITAQSGSVILVILCHFH